MTDEARPHISWNPVTGCAKTSGGCRFCYAERLSERYGRTSRPWSAANAVDNIVLHPERLAQPRTWRKPRDVFAGSMTDIFGEFVPEEYLARIAAAVLAAPTSRFWSTTKRAERMRASLSSSAFWELVRTAALDEQRLDPDAISTALSERRAPNWTLGVSIESDRFASRADELRATPADRRIVIAEPLLGPIPSLGLDGIDELSVGGESGGSAERALVEHCPNHTGRSCGHCMGTGWAPRPERIEWVRELRDLALAAGVAFTFHQWGGPYNSAGGNILDGRKW